MTNLLWVAAGGAIGAALRYLVSMKITAEIDVGFPWGTLLVNLIGCFVIGLMWSIMEHKTTSDELLLFLMVGLIGSFTTFSTYGLEGIQLIQYGEMMAGVGYIILSNVAGLLLVIIAKSMLDRFFAVMG